MLKNGCDTTEYYFRAGLEPVRDLVRLSVYNDQLARGHVTSLHTALARSKNVSE